METVGDFLRKERKRQKKYLQSISLDTKIDEKKLKALEENNFDIFESPVSTKGFMKIYAEYLGLDPERVLAIYRRDFGTKIDLKKKKEIESEKKDIEKDTKFSMKYVIYILPIFLLLGIFIYLYNQFSHFQNPPELKIVEPKNNTIVHEEILTIRGITERDAIVEIGDSKVPVNENGEFTTKVNLKENENIISTKAISARNPSKENTEVLYITYEKKEEVKEIEEEEKKLLLKVEVQNNPTWVEIIIDDQLMVSQVLQINYEKEFEAKRNIQVNTGILQNTKVFINGEQKGLSPENFSIRCELEENEINCF